MTWRSNCANESSILSVNRPMLVVVLKLWVILTKLARALSRGQSGRSFRVSP